MNTPERYRTYSVVDGDECLLAWVSQVGVDGVTWCRVLGDGHPDWDSCRTESLAAWNERDAVLLSYTERLQARLDARRAEAGGEELELV